MGIEVVPAAAVVRLDVEIAADAAADEVVVVDAAVG